MPAVPPVARYGERKAIVAAEDEEGPSYEASKDAAICLPQNPKRHAGVTYRVERPGALLSASCPGCDLVLGLPREIRCLQGVDIQEQWPCHFGLGLGLFWEQSDQQRRRWAKQAQAGNRYR
jgi:hypothetical protein